VEIPWALSRWRGEERVLDVGYAYAAGYYLTALLALPIPSLHGVDWSAAPVPGMARARGDLRALPYREGAFDLVICISTIEHVGMDNMRYGLAGHRSVGGDVAALREMERTVRLGGRVLITVPFGRREEHDWFVQYDSGRWEDLVGSTSLREEEREVFELAQGGWVRATATKKLERLSYGQGAPAARAVLCASLVRPG
jgi:SAM-dependent methyltransferase